MPINLKFADELKLRQVRDLILSDIRIHYNLPELALRSKLNEFKLKMGFKQIFGESIYAFLQNQRMLRGQYLLKHTEDDIKDIALQCGYNYSTNFIFVFRQKFGMKPTEWRKQNKGYTPEVCSPCITKPITILLPTRAVHP